MMGSWVSLQWNAGHLGDCAGTRLKTQAAEMQPDGQTSTHSGESLWPSHSVQVAASILKKILPELIALVGQTGLQSPQAVHMSGSIFIAMMLSFISAFAGRSFQMSGWPGGQLQQT
jgi:hypothetical protein